MPKNLSRINALKNAAAVCVLCASVAAAQDSLPQFRGLHAGMPVSELLAHVKLDRPFDRTKCRPVTLSKSIGCYLDGRLGPAGPKGDISIYLDSDSSDVVGFILLRIPRPNLQATIDDYSAVVKEWSELGEIRTYTSLTFRRQSNATMPEGCGRYSTLRTSRSTSTVTVDCIGWADNGEPPRLEVELMRRP